MKSKNSNYDAIVVGWEVAIVKNHPENRSLMRLRRIKDDEDYEGQGMIQKLQPWKKSIKGGTYHPPRP